MISHTGTETRPRLLREAAVGNIVISHTGTETRPRLLREAAVGNFPVWLIILSDQLLIEALVSHYLTKDQ